MLEHVTANQVRFVTPGLTADPRGVALGRLCLALLPSLDRVVGLLRGLSRQTSLDDLLDGLKVEQVVTPLRSQEFVVLLPVRSSHAADGIAAVTALNGGLLFTGTNKHFVQFRDQRSPLGYDTDSILAADPGDYVLYAADFTQSYGRSRELSLERLVLDLSLEKVHRDAPMAGEEVLLRVAPGLWRAVLGYLYRGSNPCRVACCEAVDQRTGDPAPRRVYLMRTVLPPRILRLFMQVPGIEVMRLKTEQVAVQLGYRHPVELTSLSGIFDPSTIYLFCGQRGRLELVKDAPRFVAAEDLVQLREAAGPLRPERFEPFAAVPVAVPLKLVPSPTSHRPVRAALIPLSRVDWVKKLVFLLPPGALERTSICLAAETIFLLGEGGLEFFPMGTLLCEEAPGVLVPLGYRVIPRVNAEVLRQHLERQCGQGDEGAGQLFFLMPDSPVVLRLGRDAFVPLSRQVLAEMPIHAPLPASLAGAPGEEGTPEPILVNEPLGMFPLWGFHRGPGEALEE